MTAGHGYLRLAGPALPESEVTSGQGNKDRNDNYLPQVKYICTTHILVKYICQHSQFSQKPNDVDRPLILRLLCMMRKLQPSVVESFAPGCTVNSN